jgi:hypothetical protein
MDKDESIIEIQKIISSIDFGSDDFKTCKVDLIKHGYNRSVYIAISDKGDKYIIKKGAKTKDLGSTNLNDVRVQNFLTYVGYEFTPKIFYWDAEEDLYIESSVGYEDVLFDSLTDDEIVTLAKQLVQVHSLTSDQYIEYCEYNCFDNPKIITTIDHINKYGFDRFELVKKTCTDKSIIDWLESNLNKNMELAHATNTQSENSHLVWGDIGGNFRRGTNELFFIDWEFAELSFGEELAYIKIHSHPSPEKFEKLVSLYAEYSKKTVDELQQSIAISEKITRVNDVVWAAMKWGEATSPEKIEKYKALTYKRIELTNIIL